MTRAEERSWEVHYATFHGLRPHEFYGFEADCPGYILGVGFAEEKSE